MADGSTVTSPVQTISDGQINRCNHEKGGQTQADADIFDALFCKWGHDETGEEANIGSSFDDLLWDDATAAAVAAASLGWQRSLTPLNLLSSSKAGGSEQQPQQQTQDSWQQGSSQQTPPQSKPLGQTAGGRTQEASAAFEGEQNVHRTQPQQQQLHSKHAVGCAAEGGNDLSNANAGFNGLPADSGKLSAPLCKAGAAAEDVQCAFRQHSSIVNALPAGTATVPQTQYNGTEATVAGCQQLLDAFNAAQQQLNMQQMHMSAAFGGGNAFTAEQQSSSMLPQLSMQSMLHLQQQMLAGVTPQGAQQQDELPQQAHQQQQPVQMTSHFSQQPGSQQGQQQATAAATGGWPALPTVSRGAAVPGNGIGISRASIQADAWQQQQQLLQQQHIRPVGFPAGLPFPGAGPGPGPGVGLKGNGAALDNRLPNSISLSGSYPTLMQPQHPGLQQGGMSAVAPALQQSLSTLLTAAGGTATHAVTGSMGPPPPHHPHQAANVAAGLAGMLPLPQQQLQAQQLPQPILPPDLSCALGLGAMNQGLAQPGPAGFPPFWQLQLAGLLRPPPVQTTSFLQLALMMQAAMQASALAGGNDTQQAAMMAAALQGLACNMRMFMPWVGAPGWCQPQQQQQQQQQLNASCLASGPMLLRQLSSSFGMYGQKATMQFGSQPQTSTTDISGQAVPGCHSLSTAGAGMAAVAATACASRGHDRADAGVRKPKRKTRPAEHNRARYDGRKIRANNRMRIKGRFVKMGPDGEPILPGEPGTAEVDNHTVHTHSDHEGSEFTDPDTHEQPASSTGRAVDHTAQVAAADMATAGEDAQMSPVVALPAAHAPAAAASTGSLCAAVDGQNCRPGAVSSGVPEHNTAGQQCMGGRIVVGQNCKEGPAAAGLPCLNSAADGGRTQSASKCSSEDGSLGHCSGQKVGRTADHGGCLTDCDGCDVTPGTKVTCSAQQQQQQPDGIAAPTAETCNGACLPDSDLLVATAGDGSNHGCKRPHAVLDCEAGLDAVNSSKRQAVASMIGFPTSAVATAVANEDQEHDDASLVVPNTAVSMEGVVPTLIFTGDNLTPLDNMHKPKQDATVLPASPKPAMDPAEAAAAIAPAGYVEEQHQKLIRQSSGAAAATTTANGVKVEAPADASVKMQGDQPDAAAVNSRQQLQSAPQDTTAAGLLPAAAAAATTTGQYQPASAALLQQPSAGGDAHVLQQWIASQAAVAGTSQLLNQLPVQLPNSMHVLHGMHPSNGMQQSNGMHPPPARPPLGFWDHSVAMNSNSMHPAHIKKPNLAALAPSGAPLPAINLLANTTFGATQQTLGAGAGPLGLADTPGLPLGLMPWAVQQPVMGPSGPLPLNPTAPGAVGVAGWPLLRPCLGPVQPVAGGQLMPVGLPGGWPLAAAGKWMLPRQARPKKRGGKNEGSEQTDSCLN